MMNRIGSRVSSALCAALLVTVGAAGCSSSKSPSGGGTGGTEPSGPSGPTMLDSGQAGSGAQMIVAAIYFLEGRDLSSWTFTAGVGGTNNVNKSGQCLLSGTYSVTGTESANSATDPVVTKNFTWVFTNCRHTDSNLGDVTFSGTVTQTDSTSEDQTGANVLSYQGTFTSTSVTLTGTVNTSNGQEQLDQLAQSCNLQENVNGTTTIKATGSLCSVDF